MRAVGVIRQPLDTRISEFDVLEHAIFSHGNRHGAFLRFPSTGKSSFDVTFATEHQIGDKLNARTRSGAAAHLAEKRNHDKTNRFS